MCALEITPGWCFLCMEFPADPEISNSPNYMEHVYCIPELKTITSGGLNS